MSDRNTSTDAASIESFPASYALHRGLAVYRFGTRDPLLFMAYPHGLSVVGDSTPTALIGALLGLGQQVITFDPPGAGRSTRPMRLTMEEMLDCAEEALAVSGINGPVAVLGHSQGGIAALAFTLEHPDRVSRLILTCTASGGPAYFQAPGAIWNRTHSDYWRMALPSLLYWLTRRKAAEKLMLNVIFQASWRDRSRFQPQPVSLRDWLRPASARIWWNQTARHLDYSSRLGEIRVPTLVMAGRHDPQMPPACSEELAAGIRHSQLVIFERSGHYPFVEESEAFQEAVRLFSSSSLLSNF